MHASVVGYDQFHTKWHALHPRIYLLGDICRAGHQLSCVRWWLLLLSADVIASFGVYLIFCLGESRRRECRVFLDSLSRQQPFLFSLPWSFPIAGACHQACVHRMGCQGSYAYPPRSSLFVCRQYPPLYQTHIAFAPCPWRCSQHPANVMSKACPWF